MTNRYSDEFKEESIRLIVESKVSIPQVSRDLGVSVWTLRDWVKRHQERAGVSTPRKAESLEEENRRLKRELAVLKQERDLLKKAAAYFAKEQL